MRRINPAGTTKIGRGGIDGETVFMGFCVLLFLAVVFIVAEAVWCWCADWHDAGVATVVNRDHTPASTSIGYQSSGKNSGPVVISSPETWDVVVNHDGTVRSMPAHPNLWATATNGTAVRVQRKQSLTGLFKSYRAVQ